MEEKSRKEPGCIHIYCGDGKGKTTAAMGLCVRAAGCGYRVLVNQFMKDLHSGERRILETIPEVTLMPAPEKITFSFRMSGQEKEAAKKENADRLLAISEMVQSNQYDVLLLDEAVYAVSAGLLDEQQLLSFLKEKPESLEVILTGRNPGDELLALADYVSEIRKIKHPFTRGLKARRGIEY